MTRCGRAGEPRMVPLMNPVEIEEAVSNLALSRSTRLSSRFSF